MSVAFRRESDEEHREPRFELPIPPGPNLVTDAGIALIERRIADLEAALPDSEDAEPIRRDLRYWKTRRATARRTAAPADGSAGFGTRVRLTLAGREQDIAIVGDDEADPATGKLAFGAPLARALFGAEAGDLVDFAGRHEAIAVLTVEPIDRRV